MDELMEAGRRLRYHIAEPTPPVSEIYRRSNRRHRRHLRTSALGGIVLVAATAGVLVAVLPSSHRLQVVTGGTGHDAAPAAAGTAVVTLTLDQESVVAGQPISGVATIDNNTGKPIPVADPACQALVTVGLANANINFTANSDLMVCPPVGTIPVGVSHQSITVATTYNGCSQDPAQASSRLPACVGPDRNIMPPLPPGTYHTVTSVPSPFRVQDSVTIRLTGPPPPTTPTSVATSPTTVSSWPSVVTATPYSYNNPGVGPQLAFGTAIPSSDIGEQSRDVGGVTYGLADQGSLSSDNYPAISHDGGRSWTIDGPIFHIAAADEALSVSTITAVSATTAYAWGDGNYLRLTTDGGRQWWGAFFLTSVDKAYENNGTLTVVLYTGNASEPTYISNDDGRTWRLQPSPSTRVG